MVLHLCRYERPTFEKVVEREGISLFQTAADKSEKAIQVLFTSGEWLEHIRRNKVRCEKGN